MIKKSLGQLDSSNPLSTKKMERVVPESDPNINKWTNYAYSSRYFELRDKRMELPAW